jgi:hypothetical protein
MAAVIDRAVGQLSFTTKTHAMEEGNQDPRFWAYFTPLATSANPARAVDDDMKKTVINELDPTRYQETRGKWPVLRNKVRSTLNGINQHYTRTGTLDGLARFVFGMGQDDSTPMVTDLSMEETAMQTPMPGLVTSLDTSAPAGEGLPGATTNLDTTPTTTPLEDPSAGEESAAFKQSLDTPSTPSDSSTAADAAKAAGAAAPAAARAAAPAARAPAPAPAPRPAPAPAPSPSVWSSIASALATAAPAGAAIYSGVVTQDAQVQAQKTLAAAQAQAAAAGGGGIFGAGTSNIGTYALYAVIGVAGIGGLMLLLNALKSKPSGS